MAKSDQSAEAGALDFAPAILRAQHENPPPLPRVVLYIALALFGVMLAWACFGRLDIIAVAQGKLIPSSYVKIVQPAESGVLREILVGDGQGSQSGPSVVAHGHRSQRRGSGHGGNGPDA